MSRVWFAGELETVASFWRIFRRDGVAFGLTSHDRDLVFDDIRHRTAPGMVPSAIRMSSGFDPDTAEVSGALDHEAIRNDDLDAGRFDGARIELGLVDWLSLERHTLYAGSIGGIARDGGQFTARLDSVKTILSQHPIPRTSPSCRAEFCGLGCGLSAARFTHGARIASVDWADNAVTLNDAPSADRLLDGHLRWVDGEAAGLSFGVAAVDGGKLILERTLPNAATIGQSVIVREGCDLRLESCSTRFDNALNFRGEPFLPGNDMLSRYPLVG